MIFPFISYNLSWIFGVIKALICNFYQENVTHRSIAKGLMVSDEQHDFI